MKAYDTGRELKIVLNERESSKLVVTHVHDGKIQSIRGSTREGIPVKLVFPSETRNLYADIEHIARKGNGEIASYSIKVSLQGCEYYSRHNFLTERDNGAVIGIFNGDALSLDDNALR